MPERIIFAGVAGSREHYCFSDVDYADWIDWAFTPAHTLLAYDASVDAWWTHLANACVVSFCRFKYPGRERTCIVGLSDQGYVFHIGKEEGFVEKIPEAGLHADDSEGFGAMSAIRQVGLHLYAVGGGGQVYQRSLTGTWRHSDEGLLLPHDTSERLSLDGLGGTGDDDLYAVGDDGCARWFDGVAWHRIAVPTEAHLRGVLAEDAKHIWICGWQGTLLLGNAEDGFVELETETRANFLSIAAHDGTIYLGTEQGVMAYDRSAARLVDTGLEPPLRDSQIVDAVDSVLWSFGYSDIARFDGAGWRRFPVEPPEGERPVPQPIAAEPRRGRAHPPTSAERFADELADRINCYRIGDWLEKLAALGGVPLKVPREVHERTEIALEPLGLKVTLCRADAPVLPEADQTLISEIAFDAEAAVLPFGLDAATLDPPTARAMLSDDTAGGRSVDIKRGDTRMTFFLPDARVVCITFAPSLVGVTELTLVRLGGSVDYAEIDATFGTDRLGVPSA